MQPVVYFTWAWRVSRTCSYCVSLGSARILCTLRAPNRTRVPDDTYLELDLGLGNILLTTVTAGNLLGLSNLAADSLSAEVLDGVGLGGVDAKSRVGLDGSESTGN